MKKLIYIPLLFSSFFLIRCKTAPKELDEKEILNPKSIVEVVSVKYGTVDDELILSATTVYLKRNVVTATIPAFITNVRVKLGDAVNKATASMGVALTSCTVPAAGKPTFQISATDMEIGVGIHGQVDGRMPHRGLSRSRCHARR